MLLSPRAPRRVEQAMEEIFAKVVGMKKIG
jgi:hypothetical protein